jgi:hypothetical protein
MHCVRQKITLPMVLAITALIFTLGFAPQNGSGPDKDLKPTVILISIDAVYRRQDVPARFHYSMSRRIGDIVVMAEILGLKPADNDGGENAAKAVLRSHN